MPRIPWMTDIQKWFRNCFTNVNMVHFYFQEQSFHAVLWKGSIGNITIYIIWNVTILDFFKWVDRKFPVYNHTLFWL